MQIIEVKNKRTTKEFIKLPVQLYKNQPSWIRPLNKDIESVFSPKQNKTFRNGACTRWILQNDNGKTIGRIAAFVNYKTANKDNNQPTGGIGFFESIDNQHAANRLFDTSKTWLKTKGMEAMDGPINFGDRSAWWGLLIHGFDIEPNYQCNYHPPYYQKLFENYGFKIYFKQFTYGRNVYEPPSAKIRKKAERVKKDPNYSFRHIEKQKLIKYAEDFRTIYNNAWTKIPGVPKMSTTQAKILVKKMKPIMDEKIIWFGYYKNEPIAFYINLPEVNQIFKHVNGKLNLRGKLIFLYHKITKKNKKMLGLVFGIAPKHQGKGIDGALIMATRAMVQDQYRRYTQIEMNWIGDFNPHMIRIVEQVGANMIKTHHTYRYLFDQTKPFERMKIKG